MKPRKLTLNLDQLMQAGHYHDGASRRYQIGPHCMLLGGDGDALAAFQWFAMLRMHLRSSPPTGRRRSAVHSPA